MLPISAVMLTTRARWWAQQLAIETWLLQQRHHLDELLIVTEDLGVFEGFAPHPRIRLIRCDHGLDLPEKRNVGVDAATCPWIVFWDDDDWHGVRRLEELRPHMHLDDDGPLPSPQIIGTTSIFFHELVGERRSYLYKYPFEKSVKHPYVIGGTMAFTKRLWERHPFTAHTTVGDEGWWTVARLAEGVPFAVIPQGDYIAMIHDTNTCNKPPRVDVAGKRVLSDSHMTIVSGGPLALAGVAYDLIPSTVLARYLTAFWAQRGEQE